MAWNHLPPDIQTAPSLTTFKNLLKNHSFIRSHFSTLFRVLYAVRCQGVTMVMLRCLINSHIIIIIKP